MRDRRRRSIAAAMASCSWPSSCVAAAIPFDRFDTAAPDSEASWIAIIGAATHRRLALPPRSARRPPGSCWRRAASSAAGRARAELALLLKGSVALVVRRVAGPPDRGGRRPARVGASRSCCRSCRRSGPLLVWSSLGHRERRNDTGAVPGFVSAPRSSGCCRAARRWRALRHAAAGAPAQCCASRLRRSVERGCGLAAVRRLRPRAGARLRRPERKRQVLRGPVPVPLVHGPMQKIAPLDYTAALAAPRTPGL